MPARTRPSGSRRRKVVGVVLVGGASLLAWGCSSQPAPQATVPGPSATAATGTGVAADGLSVSGVGEVSGAPDTLTVTFGVSLRRDSVATAVADNATVQTKLLGALTGSGVDDKDVRTNSYNVSPSFASDQGKQVPNGFQVTNAVVVKVHDLPKAGAIIDSATQAGGNDVVVQGVAFTLEDNQPLLASARDKAYANAKAKAEQFAKLSGRPLGPIVSITETTSPRAGSFLQDAAGAAAAAAPTPISPGELSASLQVDVRYSFG